MITYAKVLDGGEIEHFRHIPPPAPPLEWEGHPGEGFMEVTGWPPSPRPDPHSSLFIQDGVCFWKDPRTLEDVLALALEKPYADIDAIVRDAVGGRTKEYEKAEAEARAFAASGYAEPAPRSVAKFAAKNPTMQPQSNTWAAQQVIGRANALAAAQDDMRDQRFESQWNMRAATTLAELDVAVATWNTFIAQLRAQLGLQEIP